MKNIRNILIMVFFYITGSVLAIGYLPWWGLGIVFAFGGLLFVKPLWQELLLGLFLGAALWAGISFAISAQNEHILYYRFVEGKILPLNPFLLTAILGGLHGLSGSLFGYMLGKWRKNFRK
ncbi:MAG: hypothetical protein ACPGYF_03685 [Chitinophagales bacterium]